MRRIDFWLIYFKVKKKPLKNQYKIQNQLVLRYIVQYVVQARMFINE